MAGFMDDVQFMAVQPGSGLPPQSPIPRPSAPLPQSNPTSRPQSPGNQQIGSHGSSSPGSGSSQDFSGAGQRGFGSAPRVAPLKRSLEVDEWTPRSKRRLITAAQEVAEELGISEEQQEYFIEAAQLPTQRLLILLLGHAIKPLSHQTLQDRGAEFISSRIFKEEVIGRVQTFLLDPNLSSYKGDLLKRVLHHIRSHPAKYSIPPDLTNFLSSSMFATTISNALVRARSSIKGKLQVAWQQKMNIYDLVTELGPKYNFEPTEQHWGRWAWIHGILGDLLDKDKLDDKFWNVIDLNLKDMREGHPELDENQRATAINETFRRVLGKHLSTFHLKRGAPKPKAYQRRYLPTWQRDLMKAVDDMNKYTTRDLADVNDEDDDDGAAGARAE